MELRHLYKLSEIIMENVNNGNLPEDILSNMEISLRFNPQIYYGIDKEFYFMTHNNSYDGFIHSADLVTARVNGVKFNISQEKETEKKENGLL